MQRKAKYRTLDRKELEQLETEFVHFLASQGIAAEDWLMIKEEKEAEAAALINVFSDIVMDKVLSKVRLLERREPKELHLYRCDPERIIWVGVKIASHSPLDLSKQVIHNELTSLFEDPSHQAQLVRAEKDCRADREMEIFKLTQAGCLVSENEKLFDLLLKLTNKNT